MVRFRNLYFVLALLALLVPAAASAQKDSQYTKEAAKYIGLAMANPDRAARTNLYTQALVHLRQGMERDAANAKVWMMSGTVLAALGEMQEADAAWKKAAEMHPDYAQDISDEREAAWVEAFNVGMQAMDAQKYPEAIKILENAELIYQGRPEALMNLGALYANAGDNAKAEDAFRRAAEATKGPLLEKLNDQQKAEWTRFRELATTNIAMIHGAAGVEAFQAASVDTDPASAITKFAQAAEHFAKAFEINPHSRDYVFNHAQSLWAQVSKLEDALPATASRADSAATKAKLMPLYTQVQVLAAKAREFDPANGNLYLIEASSYRKAGDITGTDAAKTAGQNKALEVLTAREVLPLLVDEVSVQSAADGATISGKVSPNKALATGALTTPAGSPVNLKFTIVGASGQPLGEATVTVNAPAEGATTPFELKTEIKGDIGGWKYVASK
jgi:tetratricopeptide (TPR) repeat protein